MIWQDLVITIAQIFFAISLFPSILSKDKPAFTTSIMNSLLLYIVGYVNFTLGLYGAMSGLLIVATLWGILAIQKFKEKKKV